MNFRDDLANAGKQPLLNQIFFLNEALRESQAEQNYCKQSLGNGTFLATGLFDQHGCLKFRMTVSFHLMQISIRDLHSERYCRKKKNR